MREIRCVLLVIIAIGLCVWSGCSIHEPPAEVRTQTVEELSGSFSDISNGRLILADDAESTVYYEAFLQNKTQYSTEIFSDTLQRFDCITGDWHSLYQCPPETTIIDSVVAEDTILLMTVKGTYELHSPVLTRIDSEGNAHDFPLSVDFPLDGGAGFYKTDLVIWSRNGEMARYSSDGSLISHVDLQPYVPMSAYMVDGAVSMVMFAINSQEQAEFLVFSPDGELVQNIPFALNRRMYSYCYNDSGIYAVIADNVADTTIGAAKKLIYIPFDAPEKEQSIKLPGEGIVYSNSKDILLRLTGTQSDSGKLFVLDQNSFSLISVDTGILGKIRSSATIVPADSGFYISAEWVSEAYDLEFATLYAEIYTP